MHVVEAAEASLNSLQSGGELDLFFIHRLLGDQRGCGQIRIYTADSGRRAGSKRKAGSSWRKEVRMGLCRTRKKQLDANVESKPCRC